MQEGQRGLRRILQRCRVLRSSGFRESLRRLHDLRRRRHLYERLYLRPQVHAALRRDRRKPVHDPHHRRWRFRWNLVVYPQDQLWWILWWYFVVRQERWNEQRRDYRGQPRGGTIELWRIHSLRRFGRLVHSQ